MKLCSPLYAGKTLFSSYSNILLFIPLHFVDASDSSKKQFRELQVKYYELKERHDDLSEKLKFFTKVMVVRNIFYFPYRCYPTFTIQLLFSSSSTDGTALKL